jgi:hypothetical protein
VAWSRELRRTEIIESWRKTHGLKDGPEMQKPHQRDVLNAAGW